MRALVAGCGYVGTELARVLVDDGHEVFALTRQLRELPKGVQGLTGDLTQSREFPPLPVVDRVFFCAAPDTSDEEGYEAIYVRGLQNLLEATSESRPTRLIFTSSTAVYAQDDGSPVDESSPTEPQGFRGRVLLEAESLALGAGLETVVLRLAGIYGPGRTRLIERLARGEAPGVPGRFLNLIHREDAAAAMRHLMRPDAPTGIYLGVDCEPVEPEALLRWLAESGGRRVPARENERARASNKRCSNRRLLDSGYQFRYPTFREGFPPLMGQEG